MNNSLPVMRVNSSLAAIPQNKIEAQFSATNIGQVQASSVNTKMTVSSSRNIYKPVT